jgi:hydroxymethylpyrimidine/phosphomethylpyrimidine kinase
MLANSEVIHAVADALEAHRPAALVLDPVMVATSGARLLDADALDALRLRLLPLATVLTPNIPEAELLLGRTIVDGAAADDALRALHGMGPKAVLLKGGHLDEGHTVVDRYLDGASSERFLHDRIALDGHGTGCTLASAIAANLCRGLASVDACKAATDYVAEALRLGDRPGRGAVTVLGHFRASPRA